MPNTHRGEIEATLAGKTYTLCLTLGALSELEVALEAGSLVGCLERFHAGRIKTSDLIHVIAAGLKGGGHEISAKDVADLPLEGGVESMIKIAADLLGATFSNSSEAVR